MKKKRQSTAITNNKARFDYDISDTLVAGIALTGAETKSLRMQQGSLRGSFVTVKNGELWLTNMLISPTKTNQNAMPEDSRSRSRKLLVTKKQQEDIAARKTQGLSVVPLKLLTKGRFIKVELGIGRGRKRYDKRQALKKRDEEREAQKARI